MGNCCSLKLFCSPQRQRDNRDGVQSARGLPRGTKILCLDQCLRLCFVTCKSDLYTHLNRRKLLKVNDLADLPDRVRMQYAFVGVLESEHVNGELAGNRCDFSNFDFVLQAIPQALSVSWIGDDPVVGESKFGILTLPSANSARSIQFRRITSILTPAHTALSGAAQTVPSTAAEIGVEGINRRVDQNAAA